MPPKIIGYDIAKAETTQLLAQAVTAKLADGWQPIGGVVQAGGALHGSYSQAIVKYAES